MFPERYGPAHRDVQIVTRSGRVAYPPPVDRSFSSTTAREELQREDVITTKKCYFVDLIIMVLSTFE